MLQLLIENVPVGTFRGEYSMLCVFSQDRSWENAGGPWERTIVPTEHTHLFPWIAGVFPEERSGGHISVPTFETLPYGDSSLVKGLG